MPIVAQVANKAKIPFYVGADSMVKDGGLAGSVTAWLHTKLKIQPLLAGILVMLALYSVNLRVMSGRANIALVNKTTVFRFFSGNTIEQYAGLIIPSVVLLI
jgi:putative ABC transport system permease protein